MRSGFADKQTLVVTSLFVAASALTVAGCGSGSKSHSNRLGQPSIAAIQPATGDVDGGDQVTITITGATFGPNAQAIFGGQIASVLSASSDTLTVSTPGVASAGPVDVTVNVDGPGSPSDTAPDGFSYSSMSITSVTPSSGPTAGGVNVTITGENFVNVTGVNILSTFNVDSATQISGVLAASIAGAGPVDVVVASSTEGTATLQNGFDYTVGGGNNPQIGIVGLDVASGPVAGGTAVTITGFGFEPGDQEVRFGGEVATITNEPDSQTIVVNTPAGAAPGFVSVSVESTNNGTTTLVDAFTYLGDGGTPVVSAVTPNSGPESGGTDITISGQNFLGADIAAIASNLLDMEILNDNTITAVTAPLDSSAGVAPLTTRVVVVSSSSGPSTEDVLYTYDPSVFLETIQPNQGPRSGNLDVTFKGRNFGSTVVPNVADVLFNGNSAVGFTVLDDETMTVTVPPNGFEGAVGVEIVGQNGFLNAFRENAFIYGGLFDQPSPPTVDNLDLMGDVIGDQYDQDLNSAWQDSETLVDMDSGPIPSQVASGDLTKNDGEFMAVTLPGSNSVYIAAGAASETVSDSCLLTVTRTITEATVALNATPRDLVWTMLDGNGVSDLVVVQDDGTVATIRLAAAPEYAEPLGGLPVQQLTLANGDPAVAVSSGDVNGDGAFDVVVARASGDLDIFLNANDGSGDLNAPTTVALPGTPVKVFACDPRGVTNLDLDPLRDIAIVDRLPFHLKQDVNRDGRTDVAVLLDDGRIAVLFGDGAGAFPETKTWGEMENPIDMVATDFNLDNRIDFVALTDKNVGVYQSRVSILSGEASIAQIQTLTFPVGAAQAQPTAVAVMDSNYDCAEDIVVGSFDVGGTNVGVWLNNGDGSYAVPNLYAAQTQNNMGAGAGFQIVDLATSRRAAVWAAQAHTGAESAVNELDRTLLTIFLGDAQEDLTAGPLPTGTDPRSIRYGDMNDDGSMDMVVANFSSNTLGVYLGDGEGNFPTQLNAFTERGPESVALGDVDNDGDSDVVVANNLNGLKPFDEITVHLNTGQGSLGSGQSYDEGGRGAREVRLADVDGDGNLDAVVVNQTSNNVSVLTGNGNGTFDAPTLYGVGNRPMSVAVADMGTPEGADASAALASDGQLDLVVCNNEDDTVSVLYNGFDNAGNPVAEGLFGAGETYPLGGFIRPNITGQLASPPLPSLARLDVQPRSVVVVDMNLDGAPDIVTADAGTDTISILHANLGNRTIRPGTRAYGGPNPANSPNYPTRITDGVGDPCPAMFTPVGSATPGTLGIEDEIGGWDSAGSPGNVRKWFVPRDYAYNNNDPNDVGVPQVVLPVGDNPHFVAFNDMNVDGRPDLVVGSFGGTDLTIYINAGSDFQNGPGGPNVWIAGQFVQGACVRADYFPFWQVIEEQSGLPGETTFRSPRFDPDCPATVPGYSVDNAVATFFTVNLPAPVTGLDVARVNKDCPPDPGVVMADGTVLVKEGE